MIYSRCNGENSKVPAKPPSPLPYDSRKQLFGRSVPREGTKEYKDLEENYGFNYRALLEELIYCCVSCGPDIGYSVTILSKFSSTPSY